MGTTNYICGKANISTRDKRRKAVSLIVFELTRIFKEEEAFRDYAPFFTWDDSAYATSDNCAFLLEAAISILDNVYKPRGIPSSLEHKAIQKPKQDTSMPKNKQASGILYDDSMIPF